MTNREKKNLLRGLCVILVLGILYVGEILLQNYLQDRRSQQALREQETSLLLSLPKEEIAKITFGIETPVILERESDGWDSPEDPYFVADEAAILRIQKDLSELTMTRNLGVVSDPGAYGLDPPANQVSIEMKDGTSHEISIGAASDSKKEVYIQVDHAPEVYLTDTRLDVHFSGDYHTFASYEAFPVIRPEQIRQISVTKGEDSYVLTTPGDDRCTVTDAKGEEHQADVGLVGMVQNDLSNITWLKHLEYHCTDFSVYGLESPAIELQILSSDTGNGEAEPKELVTLFLGDCDDSGNYYVRRSGSSQVHTIRREYLTGLSEATAQSFWSRNFSFVSIGDLDYLDVTVDGKTHTLRRVSKDGLQDDAHLTWYVDGQEVSKDLFTKFYYDCVSVTAQERLSQVPNELSSPKLTLLYVLTDGTKKQLEYYPTDQNFYTVVYDGGNSAASVNRLYVNTMLESCKSLLEAVKN